MNKLNKTQKRSLRRRARKKLSKLLERQSHQCYWCKQKIYIRSDLNPSIVIRETHGSFIVRSMYSPSKTHTLLKATVDHLQRIEDGGRNDISNLAASCYECNNRRVKNYNTRHKSPCKICGNKKERGYKKLCNHCTWLSSLHCYYHFLWKSFTVGNDYY